MTAPIWGDGEEMPHLRPTPLGWVRVLARGGMTGLIVFGGLGLHTLLRIPERLTHGEARPWTPYVTQGVCIMALRVIGIAHHVEGRPMDQRGAIVANHGSWLDIFALNAAERVVFTAKSEVARWPGIGWLARATGTLFVRRDRKVAAQEAAAFEARLRAGDRILFFPEGTSTDGRRVLAFKPTLFAAFYADGHADDLHVQPVTLVYDAPEGHDPRFYGWWGEMTFGGHLLHVLGSTRQGRVRVIWHDPLRVRDHADRKALAKAAEERIRGTFHAHVGASQTGDEAG